MLAKCKQKIQKTQKNAGIDGLKIPYTRTIEVIKHKILMSQLSLSRLRAMQGRKLKV